MASRLTRVGASRDEASSERSSSGSTTRRRGRPTAWQMILATSGELRRLIARSRAGMRSREPGVVVEVRAVDVTGDDLGHTDAGSGQVRDQAFGEAAHAPAGAAVGEGARPRRVRHG